MSWTHPESTKRKLRKSDALAIQLPSSSRSNIVSIFEKYDGIRVLIEGSDIISKDEIMEYADYISRLDFYCMELTLSKKDTKQLKDLKLDCIREHKSAIDMVTSFSIDKYLISK